MQLQWNQTPCSYLRRDLWETQNLEQSQELRLPEGMPDIGRVICAWGQPVLRSKEWRKDDLSVTCGVNAWVLYAPEDGSMPQCLEIWLPFQAKWNLPASQREGTIRVSSSMRSVDARTLSARKIMVRASLGLQVEALEPAACAIYHPGDLPEGVQVLEKTYPALLPREAGEKVFTLEEEAVISGEMPGKILYCCAYPVVTEQTVMGSRAIFKGNCKFRLLYMTETGAFGQWLGTAPFAQYADLEREYDKEAQLSVTMAVSSLETDVTEQTIRMKCGLVAQYLVRDRQLMQLVEDAYSPWQAVQPVAEALCLPMVLDRTQREWTIPAWMPPDAGEVVDLTIFPDQPIQFREGENVVTQQSFLCQALYRDADGTLCCSMEDKNEEWSFPLAENGRAYVRLEAVELDDRGQMNGKLEAVTVAEQTLPMITGLHMGEKTEPDPERPSLIICRPGGRSLWELAKNNGSTMELIRKANQLTDGPEAGTVVLIPIA